MQAELKETILLLPGLLMSLTVHEYAHARTALAFGDPTARNAGRCTLNPLAHLDLVGTLCMIFAHFGWAKPVPVNPHNLHPPRLGDILVSLAGPMSNLALAIALGLAIKFLPLAGFDLAGSPHAELVGTVLWITLGTNIMLAVFNLIPLFPLDGHHILREHLPFRMQAGFMHWQRKYGFILLLALMFLPRITSGTGMPHLDPLGFIFRHAMHVFGLAMGMNF